MMVRCFKVKYFKSVIIADLSSICVLILLRTYLFILTSILFYRNQHYHRLSVSNVVCVELKSQYQAVHDIWQRYALQCRCLAQADNR